MIAYTYSGKTDIGCSRKVNQDSFGYVQKPWGSIFVLSDGFGHRDGGKFASQSTVDIFIDNFTKKEPISVKEFLDKTFEKINKYINYKKVSTFEKSMLGCTAVVLILKNNTAYIAHIGDSRIYLVRDEQFQQLTKDHSYVQSLIDNDELSPEEAKNHIRRNVLVRALGNSRHSAPDYSVKTINQNDIFMLCCDGVWGASSSNELIDILIKNSPSDATAKIIRSVKKNGGLDNITVQVISFT